jgi:sec-independent protein translocase protein TatA
MNFLTIFLGQFGPVEIVLVLAVIVLLFGGKKIPELMKGLGTGIKEFKNAAKDDSTTPAKKEEDTKE